MTKRCKIQPSSYYYLSVEDEPIIMFQVKLKLKERAYKVSHYAEQTCQSFSIRFSVKTNIRRRNMSKPTLCPLTLSLLLRCCLERFASFHLADAAQRQLVGWCYDEKESSGVRYQLNYPFTKVKIIIFKVLYLGMNI